MVPMIVTHSLNVIQGFEKASSEMRSEAGTGWEAGHLLSSSLHRAGEGEAGGGLAGEVRSRRGLAGHLCGQIHSLLLQAQSKEIRLRLDEERKERIEKRF